MDFKNWHRLEYQDTPIYVFPEGPDWIVPNPQGDELLLAMKTTQQAPDATFYGARARQFCHDIALPGPVTPYAGRNAHLKLTALKECWFHITDKCNLSCRHCMFSCSPADTLAMGIADFTLFFNQAFDLGARTFFLTGGEPMVHPDFKEICTLVLNKDPENNLVILTNGMLADSFLPFFKTLPQDRLHFQVSLDGNQTVHDAIRGQGAYAKILTGVKHLAAVNNQISFAMAVSWDNLDFMADIVDIALQHGVSNIHYLWMFATGKSDKQRLIPAKTLFNHLVAAQQKADRFSITIDNIKTIEGQVFSPQGTKYDLGNAGWESLAIAPDGKVYPTPALIREQKAVAGSAHDGLEQVWKQSKTLSRIRALSVAADPDAGVLKFIIGGGDMDHSYHSSGHFIGHDPYMELYQLIALWRISLACSHKRTISWPGILLRMGDRLLNCDDTHGEIALTHSNCVLSLSSLKSRVSGFYSAAATDTNTDIINPVCYPEEEISHVPAIARVRSYGCGSPVLDAGIAPGETLVDLGSGAGMECFIAARRVGQNGRVFGIDMTDQMLDLARKSLVAVEQQLGYRNITFKKAFLENMPMADAMADIVISNCVINLSSDKHTTFGEIFRILKPGGRIVISDITTDTTPSPAILNDPLLRGECIAGAMTQTRLMSVLEIAGFENICISKRFFYREIQGHYFYSITYMAFKPDPGETEVPIVYPGPFAAVITDSGQLLVRGERRQLKWHETMATKDQVFILDEKGNAANIDAENTCACCLPPETKKDAHPGPANPLSPEKSMTGCMQCGHPLLYFTKNKNMTCLHCGFEKSANAACEKGHFICDSCHSKDAYQIVMDLCVNTRETRMITLLNTIRHHPAMPLHGPEHHFAVPGAIVAAYRNLGGKVNGQHLVSALERGKTIPGGTCGFWGGCGAALGVGIAFGIILESTPIKPAPRQIVQQITGHVIEQLSRIQAARCCQREAWTAMIIAGKLSERYLPIPLPVETDPVCTQMGKNKECPGKACPFFHGPVHNTP